MEVAEQLEERGFEVIVATNGTEALKLFRERQPNVVLLAVNL
jgi:DNA-binding response OmpR family regulator